MPQQILSNESETDVKKENESKNKQSKAQPIVIQNYNFVNPGSSVLKARSLSSANLYLSHASLSRNIKDESSKTNRDSKITPESKQIKHNDKFNKSKLHSDSLLEDDLLQKKRVSFGASETVIINEKFDSMTFDKDSSLEFNEIPDSKKEEAHNESYKPDDTSENFTKDYKSDHENVPKMPENESHEFKSNHSKVAIENTEKSNYNSGNSSEFDSNKDLRPQTFIDTLHSELNGFSEINSDSAFDKNTENVSKTGLLDASKMIPVSNMEDLESNSSQNSNVSLNRVSFYDVHEINKRKNELRKERKIRPNSSELNLKFMKQILENKKSQNQSKMDKNLHPEFSKLNKQMKPILKINRSQSESNADFLIKKYSHPKQTQDIDESESKETLELSLRYRSNVLSKDTETFKSIYNSRSTTQEFSDSRPKVYLTERKLLSATPVMNGARSHRFKHSRDFRPMSSYSRSPSPAIHESVLDIDRLLLIPSKSNSGHKQRTLLNKRLEQVVKSNTVSVRLKLALERSKSLL